ncbi:hypothetical protein YPPY103_1721, partial [Yersinia pestis PY-103]
MATPALSATRYGGQP